MAINYVCFGGKVRSRFDESSLIKTGEQTRAQHGVPLAESILEDYPYDLTRAEFDAYIAAGHTLLWPKAEGEFGDYGQ